MRGVRGHQHFKYYTIPLVLPCKIALLSQKHATSVLTPFRLLIVASLIKCADGELLVSEADGRTLEPIAVAPPGHAVVCARHLRRGTSLKSYAMAGALPTKAAGAQRASSRHVVGAVLFFCASSLGAIFINKACLTHFRFSFPFFLMLLQVCFTYVGITVAGHLYPQRFAPLPVKRADLKRLVVPTMLFVANVSVGLSALTRVNIPMFSAFRRITVLFVMAAEYVVLQKVQSRRIIASVCALAVGAFISALGDVTFSALGYCLVFANNILTALYLASIKKILSELNMTPYSLLYYMSLLSFGPVLVLAVVTGDLTGAVADYNSRPLLHTSPLFGPALLFVAASALCVNLSTSMCTHVTSPLTTSVAGQLKNVLQTVLGFFVCSPAVSSSRFANGCPHAWGVFLFYSTNGHFLFHHAPFHFGILRVVLGIRPNTTQCGRFTSSSWWSNCVWILQV